MEPYLLQMFMAFLAGLVIGIIIMLLVNKLRSGTMSPSTIKKEYQDYQAQVEEHFEETSKKFKDMTEQYQDLYKHLSVGATSLCRPDSVAATLADASESTVKLEKPKEVKAQAQEKVKEAAPQAQKTSATKSEPVADKKVPTADKKVPTADKEVSTADKKSITEDEKTPAVYKTAQATKAAPKPAQTDKSSATKADIKK